MPSPEVVIRLADAHDTSAIEDALMWAVNWTPEREPVDRATVLSTTATGHYVRGWPLPNDLGVVAEHGEAVGAAWLRYLPADDPGYGFIAADVPELSIGVHPQHRGHGIGRALLKSLLQAARRRAITRVSLSVERANPARDLYLSVGFRVVDSQKDADTLLATLTTNQHATPTR